MMFVNQTEKFEYINLIEKSVHLNSNVKIAEDQFTFILCIIISYPLGFLNLFIHGYNFRLIYSIVFGFSLQFYYFGSEIKHILVCFFSNFILVKFCNRKSAGKFCTLFSFAYLSFINLKIMIFDYAAWKMDITTILMMNLCKHSAYAFNYSDGLMNIEETTDKNSKDSITNIILRRKKYLIKEINFLEYFGYIFTYSTCLMGPFFEFHDFVDFLHEENNYKDIKKLSCFIDSLKSIFYGLFFALIYMIFKNVSTANFYFNNYDTDRKEINFLNIFILRNSHEINFFHRLLFYYIILFQKYKYHVAFFLSEGACKASGLSWDSLKKNTNKIKNIEISVVENIFSINTRDYFQNWNISVHHWLKNYVYFRLYSNLENYKDNSKIQKAKSMTFMISAIWHGFYPCYLIVFGHFALCLAIETNIEYIKKNYFLAHLKDPNEEEINLAKEKSVLYNYISYIYSFIILSCMSYNYALMESLAVKDTFFMMKNFYFIPSFLVIILLKITEYYAEKIKKDLKNNIK